YPCSTCFPYTTRFRPMDHIEQACVHSGESACSLPAYTLSQEIQDKMREQVEKLAMELGVRGLMNTQFAVKDNEVYLIEVNPRAADRKSTRLNSSHVKT